MGMVPLELAQTRAAGWCNDRSGIMCGTLGCFESYQPTDGRTGWKNLEVVFLYLRARPNAALFLCNDHGSPAWGTLTRVIRMAMEDLTLG